MTMFLATEPYIDHPVAFIVRSSRPLARTRVSNCPTWKVLPTQNIRAMNMIPMTKMNMTMKPTMAHPSRQARSRHLPGGCTA